MPDGSRAASEGTFHCFLRIEANCIAAHDPTLQGPLTPVPAKLQTAQSCASLLKNTAKLIRDGGSLELNASGVCFGKAILCSMERGCHL